MEEEGDDVLYIYFLLLMFVGMYITYDYITIFFNFFSYLRFPFFPLYYEHIRYTTMQISKS